ncbi:MAG: FtsX-like permease family protein [Rhodospirillales bacterium]
MRRAGLVVGLAWRDLTHELRLFFCMAAGFAAVLAPLIVLFGLKHGVIEGLRETLIENPRARMVVNTANRSYDRAFFDRLAARPDVAFVVPRMLFLHAASLRFERPDRPGTTAQGDLLATAAGDPLLGALPPPGPREMVVSASLAARLSLAPGTPVTLRAVRGDGPTREVMNLALTVSAVAPPAAYDRDGAFVPLPVLSTAYDFLDDLAPPDAQPGESANWNRSYAGFRAHARRLEDVVALDHALRSAGVEVDTRAGEIAGLLALDRNLALLFALIAGLGGLGYLVSLGVGLYANVERKRRELSLLRLVGITGRGLTLLPVTQAAAIALCGAAIAAAVALAVAAVVNRVAADAAMSEGHALCSIAPVHLAVATAVTLAGAVLAAAFAGARAARIEPAEGLRDE